MSKEEIYCLGCGEIAKNCPCTQEAIRQAKTPVDAPEERSLTRAELEVQNKRLIDIVEKAGAVLMFAKLPEGFEDAWIKVQRLIDDYLEEAE
jgi:hypothetical protein